MFKVKNKRVKFRVQKAPKFSIESVCFKSRKGRPNYLTINLILTFCF